MPDNKHLLDLASFIDEVMRPTESLSNMFHSVSDSTPDGSKPPKVKTDDLAVVVGALSSLSRHRLQEFARHLQAETGFVKVEQAYTYEAPVRVESVTITKNVGLGPQEKMQ